MTFFNYLKIIIFTLHLIQVSREIYDGEIHDYDRSEICLRSAHAQTMRMIDIGSEISQLDNNSTCVSCFGGNLCSFLKSCDSKFESSIN